MNRAAGLPSSSTSADPITFSFGRKWDELVRTALSQERIDIARRCLLEYLKLPDLHDMKDGPGGNPYEHAKVEEVVFFCRDELGCVLENLRTGEGYTEYLFQRPAAAPVLPATTPPARTATADHPRTAA